ncbi:MAG: pimeloyl-ACP methyl ester esterase BioH [Moraxellaceae bacterium]|nr:pimeloyl-ACP methyl ester esterase BioH [Moraxellaceae bacterium]
MSGVFYEDHACTTNPDAATVVLLHGWGMHSGVWQDFVPLLTAHVHVRCIDLPGFGHGSAMAAPESLDDMVAAVMLAAPARAIWAGWSLGGLVALAIAARHPDRVTALVLLAATPCFVQKKGWLTAMPPVQFETFSDATRQNADVALKMFMTLQCKGSVSMKSDLRFLQAASGKCGIPHAATLLSTLDLLGTSDLREAAAQLDIPVLAITGEDDVLVPAGVAAALGARNPRCTAHVVTGAAHVPFISHPGHCRDAILTFMQAIHE